MTRTKGMNDAEWIKSMDKLHGLEALRFFGGSEFSASSDPYYKDLTAALWKLFARALAEEIASRQTLLTAWANFKRDYRTEGCPDPNCLVCSRSKKAEADMVRCIDEVRKGLAS